MPIDTTALIVEHLHRQFVKDRNPLYVWHAYQATRRRQVPCLRDNGKLSLMAGEPLPLPAWVLDYLDHVAKALLAGTRPKDALGLAIKGGHSHLNQLTVKSRDVGIYSYVDLLMSLDDDEFHTLPTEADLCPGGLTLEEARALFKPLLPKESRLDRICDFVAEETGRKGNGFSRKPLSAKTVRDLYFRLKRKV